MPSSASDRLQDAADQVFKVADRTLVGAVVAFGAAHLDGPARTIGLVLAGGLLFLAAFAAMDPLLAAALTRQSRRRTTLLRFAGCCALALAIACGVVFTFHTVLPVSG